MCEQVVALWLYAKVQNLVVGMDYGDYVAIWSKATLLYKILLENNSKVPIWAIPAGV